ncbi:hypothetical protein GTZ99_12585 [Novosphingobium sp. FSY-8]|uniref:Uncharacterized protein n=1 Tax=Novosphingobium ovatum TaxID=1908523 RepID=A0ABW9XFY2_9SPHN|nr:hypothetical protein [Novosphingobium ovatum]NBC37388.1 hypothetical protein [Novosphingobium ovatum]
MSGKNALNESNTIGGGGKTPAPLPDHILTTAEAIAAAWWSGGKAKAGAVLAGCLGEVAQAALSRAERAVTAAQFSPAPWCDGAANVRAITPDQVLREGVGG